jgi:pimeloyl-ACP methyl ester carboxylesterase
MVFMDKSSSVNLNRVPQHAPENAKANLDVVFIHGLGGCATDTWTNSNGGYWPQWVADDHPNAQVWALDYPAKIGKLLDIGSDQPGTSVLSTLILEKLVTSNIGHRPCIFVCHSLGGLITKRILLDAYRQDIKNSLRFQHENVKGLMFCGTPHRGSAIADVLTYLEVAKNTLPFVLQCLGLWEGIGIATKSVLTTSELIEELRNNNIDLQFLNEDFGVYFGARSQDFLVKVFAETESIKGAMVVSADSANPNLRPDSKSAPLPVIPVPGKDHSQLVKPDHKKEFVVEGLDHLIRLVADGELSFNLANEWQSRMAAQFHAEFMKCPDVVSFSCFPKLDDAHHVFDLARYLAQLTDEAIIAQLGKLSEKFQQIPTKNREVFDLMHACLLNVGTLLLLTYIHNHQALSVKSNPGDLVEILTPCFDNREELILLAESFQAAVRHWPVKIKLSDDRSAVTWGNRTYTAAAAAPCSWNEEDHFNHLVQRILVLKPITTGKLGGDDLVEMITEAELKKSNFRDVQQVKRLLETHLQKQLAHVLNGVDLSSPYATEPMRHRLNKEFGPLLSVLLPDHDKPNPSLEKLLINAQIDAQQFLLEALEAMESRP